VNSAAREEKSAFTIVAKKSVPGHKVVDSERKDLGTIHGEPSQGLSNLASLWIRAVSGTEQRSNGRATRGALEKQLVPLRPMGSPTPTSRNC
jgi:hypothetical protein